jgi:hypothetical protein
LSELALGTGAAAVIWNAIAFVISICLVVAVFNISGAAQRTARDMAQANARIAAIMQHLGVAEAAYAPPCRVCARRGNIVAVQRNPRGVLQCPACGAERK